MHKLHVIMGLGGRREGSWMTKISGGSNEASKTQIISETQRDTHTERTSMWKIDGWMISSYL